jgi:hypothetical protein
MEFFWLLFVTLLISVFVTMIVIVSFKKPIKSMLIRIIGDEIAIAWQKFLTFALFVVGIGSGVSIHKLERFIAPVTEQNPRLELTAESWALEIYRTIISTLGGLAWALLIFFVFALIAFVIVRGREKKEDKLVGDS